MDTAEIRCTVKLEGRLPSGVLRDFLEMIKSQNLLPGCKGLVADSDDRYAWLAFFTVHTHLEDHLTSYASGLLAGFVVARGGGVI